MGNNSVIVKFNALKHHLGFLRKEINRWKQLEWQEVRQGIQGLGSNQFDLYTGTLESAMILSEAGDYLKNNGIDSRERLRAWLGRKGYRTFSLSDGSRWVVRESEETETICPYTSGPSSTMGIQGESQPCQNADCHGF